ncbi:MAG: hypothetical protein LUF30_02425, partial [Lachnospiraceae bacterium]|nr:hypothetical protein [Lachnospiraceae bacterium]
MPRSRWVLELTNTDAAQQTDSVREGRFDMDRKGILIVVSGYSGVGKGTLMKALTSRYGQYALSIS